MKLSNAYNSFFFVVTKAGKPKDPKLSGLQAGDPSKTLTLDFDIRTGSNVEVYMC